METHVKVLGLLYIVLGAIGLLAAFALLVIVGGVAGIVGATAVPDDPDAWIALPILGIVGTALFFFLVLMSLPGIVAGVGLLKFRSWARLLAIVLSILNLLFFPLGTVLGIYGLWVLLSRDSEPLFAGQPPAG